MHQSVGSIGGGVERALGEGAVGSGRAGRPRPKETWRVEGGSGHEEHEGEEVVVGV